MKKILFIAITTLLTITSSYSNETAENVFGYTAAEYINSSENTSIGELSLLPAKILYYNNLSSHHGPCIKGDHAPGYWECRGMFLSTAAGVTYGVSTTLLVLLLKTEEVRPLLEYAERFGKNSPELDSLVQQIKNEFKVKTGEEISNELVLQTIYMAEDK
jgi:hypothetical protein